MMKTSNPIRKDMSNMSFVGLHNTIEGIIGFADSKATRKLNNGTAIEDKNRGTIRKIFKNKHFICVTHGNNELFNIITKMNMEDYFEKYLQDEYYEDFFELMYFRLLKNPPEYNDGMYQFIIGSKDEKGFYICKVYINVKDKVLRYTDKDYSKRIYYAGEAKYVQIYDLLDKPIDKSMEQSIHKIKKQIESMIDLFDEEDYYNSVGKPVIIETFS